MRAWFERGCINSEFLPLFRRPGFPRRCTSPVFVICATGIDRYKRSQAFNLYVMRSEKPHCDTGVVPPSVAAAFHTQICVESSLV